VQVAVTPLNEAQGIAVNGQIPLIQENGVKVRFSGDRATAEPLRYLTILFMALDESFDRFPPQRKPYLASEALALFGKRVSGLSGNRGAKVPPETFDMPQSSDIRRVDALMMYVAIKRAAAQRPKNLCSRLDRIIRAAQ
jgi:hypothetical protein